MIAWIEVYDKSKIVIKIAVGNQLVSRGIWFLVVILLGCESNDDNLGAWKRVIDWIVCHSDYKPLHQGLLSVIHQVSESERQRSYECEPCYTLLK